ncbi:MAG: T9SS C-terminal target domain-containing protein, partial [Ignavibacteriales bacterium]
DITVWDLHDRSTWELVLPSWETQSNATVHNLFIKGNYAHVSYYSDGYVVLDISSPDAPYLIGHYDTQSLWGCYPYLPSGLTIVSDMNTGLYVLEFTPGEVSPTINHSGTPDVFNNDPVTINAQIVDNGDIIEANLFYRTTFNGTTSSWNLVTPANQNSNYQFTIPGFQHLTNIEYYIAAQDDYGYVVTLPEGGSGTGPAGNLPPSQFFSYSVVITGLPVLHSFTPGGDTTVVVNSEFDIVVYAEDTTGLELIYSWKKNGIVTNETSNIYHYRAFQIPAPPRTDSIEVTISNGYFSLSNKWVVHISPATDVKDNEPVLTYQLEQNYPNPFNPETQITFSVPSNEFVNLSVYNLIGEKVTELVNENLSPGRYNINFNGDKLTSGIYLARIKAGSFDRIIKMILLK